MKSSAPQLEVSAPSSGDSGGAVTTDPLRFPSSRGAAVVAQRLLERENVATLPAAMNVRGLVVLGDLVAQTVVSTREVEVTAGD